MKKKHPRHHKKIKHVPDENFKPRFSEKHLSEILEWFEKVSQTPSETTDEKPQEKSDEVVTIDQIIQFLEEKRFHKREYNYPNYGQIMKVAQILHVASTKTLAKDQLLFMLDTWIIEPDLKHELLLAFKVFDSENRSFFDLDEIKVFLTAYGEPFDDKETLELLRDANVRDDGNVFYEDFVESLFSLAPELSEEIKAEFLYENPNEDPSVL